MKIVRGRTGHSELRAAYATGNSWADPVLGGEHGVTMGHVFFEPRARTYWHRHERGQILIVTSGIGLLFSRSGEGGAQLLERLAVAIVALALAPRLAVPVEPERRQVGERCGRVLRTRALRIEILDAHEERRPPRAREAPRQQRGAEVAEVERPRWARGIAAGGCRHATQDRMRGRAHRPTRVARYAWVEPACLRLIPRRWPRTSTVCIARRGP